VGNITMGLDVGDRFSQLCVVDQDGVVIQEDRIPNDGCRGAACCALRHGGVLPIRTPTSSRWSKRSAGSWYTRYAPARSSSSSP